MHRREAQDEPSSKKRWKEGGGSFLDALPEEDCADQPATGEPSKPTAVQPGDHAVSLSSDEDVDTQADSVTPSKAQLSSSRLGLPGAAKKRSASGRMASANQIPSFEAVWMDPQTKQTTCVLGNGVNCEKGRDWTFESRRHSCTDGTNEICQGKMRPDGSAIDWQDGDIWVRRAELPRAVDIP